MNIAERIKTFIDFKGLKIAEFERSTGMSNGSFSKNLKDNRSIASDKLEIILQTYPEINPQWLLTGVGNMLQKESDQFTHQAQNKQSAPHCQHCISKDLRITDLSKTIQIQDKLIESLEREIKHFKPPD